MKIVFMGTPDFAVKPLEKLIKTHNVVAVYTQSPKQANRGHKINKSAVHTLAESYNIPVFTPLNFKSDEEFQKLKSLNADIIVVAAYGMLLPQKVLEAFRFGAINIHASLLPRWRGAAPIQRAIEAGDEFSGVSIMNMVLKLDAGDVILTKSTPITLDTNSQMLHDDLAQIAAETVLQALVLIENNQAKLTKQDESLVTYAAKIDTAELKLNFNQEAEIIERKIRAFAPKPALYFEYKGVRIKVLKALCKNLKKINILAVKL
jgi:methionyl-tRNA formyltransferase